MVIDKRALVNPDNVKNSTCVINNDHTLSYIGISENKDTVQINLSIDWTRHNFKQAEAPKGHDFLKKGIQYPKLWSNQSHQMVTCTCTYKEYMIYLCGGSVMKKWNRGE